MNATHLILMGFFDDGGYVPPESPKAGTWILHFRRRRSR